MKKNYIKISIIAMIFAITTLLTACGNETPTTLDGAIESSAKNMLSSNTEKVLEKFTDGGSVEVFIDTGSVNVADMDKITFKAYFENETVSTINTILRSPSFIEPINATIFIDDEKIVVEEESVLVDDDKDTDDLTAIGLNFADIEPLVQTYLGVSLDSLMPATDDASTDLNSVIDSINPEEFSKELEEIFNRVMENSISTTNVQDGDNTIINATITNEDLADMLETLYAEFNASANLTALMDALMPYVNVNFGEAGDFESFVEELRTTEPYEIDVELTTDKDGNIIAASIILEQNGETGSINYEILGNGFSLNIVDNDESILIANNNYEDDTILAHTFLVRQNGEEIASGNYIFQKETGKFTLDVTSYGEKAFSCAGEWLSENNEIIFKLYDLMIDKGQGLEEIPYRIGINIVADDKAPSMPEYKNFMDLTQTELSDIMTKFVENMIPITTSYENS